MAPPRTTATVGMRNASMAWNELLHSAMNVRNQSALFPGHSGTLPPMQKFGPSDRMTSTRLSLRLASWTAARSGFRLAIGENGHLPSESGGHRLRSEAEHRTTYCST